MGQPATCRGDQRADRGGVRGRRLSLFTGRVRTAVFLIHEMGIKCLLSYRQSKEIEINVVKHPPQCLAYSKQLVTMMMITITTLILGQDRREWTGRTGRRFLRGVSEEQSWEVDRTSLGAPLPEGRDRCQCPRPAAGCGQWSLGGMGTAGPGTRSLYSGRLGCRRLHRFNSRCLSPALLSPDIPELH